MNGEPDVTWRDCPTCWAQGRILTPIRRPRGDLIGYTIEPCPDCLGTGQDTPPFNTPSEAPERHQDATS